MKRLIDYKSRFRLLKGGKVSLVISAMVGSITLSYAAPQGGTVTSGVANIVQSGKVTNITQSSQKAAINWNKFNISKDEIVNFKQPNVNSITLNRVIGNERSIINGALNANGQVWILNSNGVLFGKNAKINTAGLLATTKKLSDTDFIAGNYNFKGDSTESVINLGTIDIQNKGSVILGANEVKNSGTIKAIKGAIHLVGADEYSINLNGNSLVNLRVEKGVLDALVENSGTIIADGGEVYLTTNAVNDLLKGVVNNTGIIEANSIDGITGYVEMFAHGGEAQVGGTIEAKDGFVETSGREFVFDDANIEAGEWLIDPVNVTIDDTLAGTIETALGSGGVTIETTDSAANCNGQACTNTENGDGDIIVNSAISWDTNNMLTLSAWNDIFINKPITMSNSGTLALYYGQKTLNTNNDSAYHVNAKVNLQENNSFITKLGTDGVLINWMIISGDTATALAKLQAINTNTTTLARSYVLGADIDASATSSWNSNKGWKPIGDDTNKFTGTFDGLGHRVSNLYIDDTTKSGVGLFGSTEFATIKNIGVVDADIAGQNYVGGLVGYSKQDSKITNSYTTGAVTGSERVGGLVGYALLSNITNSYTTGAVTGSESVGGLVGYSELHSNITNSYTTGAVTGSESVGGLVGYSEFGSDITNSYATGAVTGTQNVGGLVGYTFLSNTTNSFYNTSSNTELSGIGGTGADQTGVTGKTTAEMMDSSTYSGWDTTNTWAFPDGSSFEGYALGGLPYLKNVTRAEDITVGETLFASGFGTELNPYTITNWTQLQNINNSNILPKYHYYNLLNDLTTTTNGYTTQVKDGDTLANGGEGWKIIGDNHVWDSPNPFKGNFNGLGYTIDSLIMNNSDSVKIALFGTIDHSSTIKNLGLTNIDLTGYGLVSGLASSNRGIIENVYVTGKVTDNNHEQGIDGGLVGSNSGVIKNSYANAIVKGSSKVGGLVSTNHGKIENSYFTGEVLADIGDYNLAGGLVAENYDSGIVENSYAKAKVTTALYGAGLVGFNQGTITNSYASGTVVATGENAADLWLMGLTASFSVPLKKAIVTNSYYDKTKNGGMFDEADCGKTTAQMRYGRTFKSTGWDIVVDDTVSSNTPILKYDTTNDKYVWAIAKTTLDYTLSDTSKTYDGATQTLNSIYTPFGADYDFLDGDYDFKEGANVVTSYTNAGTHNIKVASKNEFLAIASTGNTDGTVTINKKGLTATNVTAKSKTYDANKITEVENLNTITGLVGSETLTITANGEFDTKDAGVDKDVVVSFTLADGSGLASNYFVNSVTKKADINKKDVALSYTASSKVYDGTTNATVTEITRDLINGDSVSISESANFSDKDAGTGKTVTISNIALSGADASNYNLATKTATTTADITQKDLTLSYTAENKIYDGTTDVTVIENRSDIITNDDLVVTEIATFENKEVGKDKTVNISDIKLSGDDANNYKLLASSDTTTATIKPRPTLVQKTINNIFNPQSTKVVLPKVATKQPQQRSGGRTLFRSGSGKKAISLSQAKQIQEQNGITEEVRIPLASNSLVALVDGGVKLPDGVEQQFFMVESD